MLIQRGGNWHREPRGLAQDYRLSGIFKAPPRRSRIAGTPGPYWLPPPRLTLAQMGDQGCGSWETPGPTLLTLRPLSSEPELPTSCPVMSALGSERGAWGWGRTFQKPPGLGQRKACLFVQNQRVFTGPSPTRLLPNPP